MYECILFLNSMIFFTRYCNFQHFEPSIQYMLIWFLVYSFFVPWKAKVGITSEDNKFLIIFGKLAVFYMWETLQFFRNSIVFFLAILCMHLEHVNVEKSQKPARIFCSFKLYRITRFFHSFVSTFIALQCCCEAKGGQ